MIQQRHRGAQVIASLGKRLDEFFGRSPIVTRFHAGTIAMTAEHGHLVVDVTGAQGVLHQMQLGSNPDSHVIEPFAPRDALRRGGAPVRHIFAAQRKLIGDELARRGPQAVGSDERVGFVVRSIGTSDAHRRFGVFSALFNGRYLFA